LLRKSPVKPGGKTLSAGPLACAAAPRRRFWQGLAQLRYGNTGIAVALCAPGGIRTSCAALTWLNLPGESHAIEWASGAPRVGITGISAPYQSGAALAVLWRAAQGRGDQ